ncbi:hypothetical protein BD626DRAFT_582891 [Schizophyllum amplum]|uniref:Uncharacterized protein n=1 Tax=Schizophyllum amplum TaxID=97359 RepID=A0A550CHR1_9AGAR|nr:hypothetical protein BD626DRAFT_582891 [Auriculariopsis ampla]
MTSSGQRVFFQSPEKGAIYVMSIDRARTLASLEDEEAMNAALVYRPRKYLVCVTGPHNDFVSPERHNSWKVAFISQGPYDESASKGIESASSVAILPNMDRVDERWPLKTSRILPTNNLYMSLPIGVTANVHTGLPIELRRWERTLLLGKVEEDGTDDDELHLIPSQPILGKRSRPNSFRKLMRASKSLLLSCPLRRLRCNKSLPKLPVEALEEEEENTDDGATVYTDARSVFMSAYEPEEAVPVPVNAPDKDLSVNSLVPNDFGVIKPGANNEIVDRSFRSNIAENASGYRVFTEDIDVDPRSQPESDEDDDDSEHTKRERKAGCDADEVKERNKPTLHLPIVTLSLDVDGAIAREEIADHRKYFEELDQLETIRRNCRRRMYLTQLRRDEQAGDPIKVSQRERRYRKRGICGAWRRFKMGMVTIRSMRSQWRTSPRPCDDPVIRAGLLTAKAEATAIKNRHQLWRRGFRRGRAARTY